MFPVSRLPWHSHISYRIAPLVLALWALLAPLALVARVPVAHAGSPPPGGLDQMTSAIAIRNGSTTDFHDGDQVLVTIAGWRDAAGAGPEAILLMPWRDPPLPGQVSAAAPISVGYAVASWEDPMTFTLHITLPYGVMAGLYYLEVRGATATAQTQTFFLTPPTTASAQRQQEAGRWVAQLAPGGLADAGPVGLLAMLSAGVFLLSALSLQVTGFRRRRTLHSRHA